MNKLAMGIDLSAQASKLSDKLKLAPAISSMTRGVDNFSEILAKQHRVEQRPKETARVDRPDNRRNDQQQVDRPGNKRTDHQEATSRSESARNRSESSVNNQEGVQKNNRSQRLDDNPTDAKVANTSAQESSQNRQTDMSENVDGEDHASPNAAVLADDQSGSDSDVSDELTGGEMESSKSTGPDADSVQNVDLNFLSEMFAIPLDGVAEGVVLPIAPGLSGESLPELDVSVVTGGVGEAGPGVLGGEVAGMLDESVAADLNANLIDDGTLEVVLPQATLPTAVDVKSQVADIEQSGVIDPAAVAMSDLPMEEIELENIEPVASAGGGSPGPIVGDMDGADYLADEFKPTRPAHLDLKMTGGNTQLAAGDAGAQTGNGQAGNGQSGQNALLMKGLENAALKSATLGDKTVGAEKFGALLSQQLEGSDSRMTQSPIDSRLPINQLREVPGLRTYTTSLPTPMNNSQWGEDFSSKVSWLANQKIQSAEIHVNPAELGPIEIKISMQNDQANIVVNSQHASVRDLLELNGHRLRDMMEGSGVGLGQFDVSDQASQQERQSKESPQSGFSAGERTTGGGDGAESEAVAMQTVHTGPVNLVDYYA